MSNNHDDHRSGGVNLYAIFAIFAALVFIIGPFVLEAVTPIKLGMTAKLMLLSFGGLMLLGGAIVMIVTKLYIKTSSDTAFVKTGMGGRHVIINGGSIVIPVVHETIWVSLRTMKLEVSRNGKDALITGDNLRADVTAEFYIKVQATVEAVIAAATSLGNKSTNPDNVRELVFEKLVSALRSVAAQKSLSELHTNREEFVRLVNEAVQKELESNGLSLESVTVSRLDQTPTESLDPNNIFDSQGACKIAEITQAKKVEKNKLEREAELEVKKQNVETQKLILDQERGQAEAEARQKQAIAEANAEAEASAKKKKAEADAIAGEAEQERDRKIQLAEVKKLQDLEVADEGKAQAKRTAEIIKEEATQMADRNREIAIAKKEEERALAEAEKAKAAKAKAEAEQAVLTVTTVQTAERDKQKAVIEEQGAIQKDQLRKEMEAMVEAFQIETKAKADLDAAQKKAEAVKVEAGAAKDAEVLKAEGVKAAKLAEAEGRRAIDMVPVEVDRKKVENEQARVDVLKQELAAKDEYKEAAIHLQIRLAEIKAQESVGIEGAKAFGMALAAADLQIWGDPQTLSKMSASFMKGQQATAQLDGMLDQLPAPFKALVNAAPQLLTLLPNLANPKDGEKKEDLEEDPASRPIKKSASSKDDGTSKS